MVVRAVVTALALFLTGAALADDWKEYENQDYSFAIHFPVDPTVETAMYQAADGRSFPAHVFSTKQETGTFKVTVVEMPGEETGPNATVMKEAIRVVTRDSAIKFDIEHRVRAVYGRQLGIVGANGGYTYVALFYRNDRLYQSRVTRLSPGDRRKLTPRGSSNRLISPDGHCLLLPRPQYEANFG